MGLLSIIILAPAVAAAALLLVPGASRGVSRIISLAGATVSLVGAIIAAQSYDITRGGVQLR